MPSPRLADPTADRVVETLRPAREVGGSELGRTLWILSGFLRDELRVRKELGAGGHPGEVWQQLPDLPGSR